MQDAQKRLEHCRDSLSGKGPSPSSGILSQEEVARLIHAAGTSFHRTLLITLYATGVRRAELTHLKVTDIDSKRMVIHVWGGKRRKDRDVSRIAEHPRQHGLRIALTVMVEGCTE